MKTHSKSRNYSLKIPFLKKLSFLFGISLVLGCGKEKIDIPWEELNSGTSSTLTSVHFTDANHGHAVGGGTWYYGISLETTDGGNTWKMDTLGNKQLFGVHFNKENKGHAVGIDGYLFKKSSPQDPWNFNKLPNWDILRDVSFNEAGQGIVVGGNAYDFGVIMTLDQNYLPVSVDTFENELSAVCYTDEKTIHVSGYGIILRSTDGGFNWTISETTGDFYRSIDFPSKTVGYIAGYSGSVLKTTDAGKTWSKLIDGDKIGVKNTPFRSVHFVDTEKGYLVGDRGTFWRTLNGGNSWQRVKNFPEVDLYDVFVINNTGYIVGENGRIFRFDD